VLQVYDEGERLRFVDTRPCAIQSNWTVDGLEAEVYRLCDSAQKPTEKMSGVIDRLLTSKVLLSMNGKLLALGVNQRN
jgi:magnesium-protoporphyrin IX monomethyl ester (oxidative) cyclase